MKSRIDYIRLSEHKKKKIDSEKKKYKYVYMLYAFLSYIIILFIGTEISVGLGIGINVYLYVLKIIIDRFKKLQFNYLPLPEDNYIEIPYKTKLQAIDAKITCHPESNPVRIMKNDSNRLYVFSNTSGSKITII